VVSEILVFDFEEEDDDEEDELEPKVLLMANPETAMNPTKSAKYKRAAQTSWYPPGWNRAELEGSL